MALTDLQHAVYRLLGEQRIRSGESYLAGGVALNELLGGAPVSRELDLFHDTEETVEASWGAERCELSGAAYALRVLRERPGFVEAEVTVGEGTVRMEWALDNPEAGEAPTPCLLLDVEAGTILAPEDLSGTPARARPIEAAALQGQRGEGGRRGRRSSPSASRATGHPTSRRTAGCSETELCATLPPAPLRAP